MAKKIDLTAEQKGEVLKLFCKSKTMKDLLENFRKSFKVLSGATERGNNPDYYVIWSPMIGGTIQVPVRELFSQEES